ncbi:MAG: TonB family protein [Fibrobacter sp.]|nr:TonB family protein [Fibrobacter sp.]
MASLFGKCWNNFVLLAAAVLWAGCSDADKNADKLPEQEKVNTEQSLSVKKENDEKARRDSVLETLKKIKKATKELEVELTGTTTLYGCRPENGCSVKIDENGIPVIDEKYLQGRARGVAKAPTYEELSVASGVDSNRVLVLRTIRQRTPGLRHIYNKHLKRNPSFSGTIVFRLNINADGAVQKVQIDSTTTGNTDFDAEVQKAVGRWNFQNMNSGVVAKLNTDVVATFPIRFYEDEPTMQGD